MPQTTLAWLLQPSVLHTETRLAHRVSLIADMNHGLHLRRVGD